MTGDRMTLQQGGIDEPHEEPPDAESYEYRQQCDGYYSFFHNGKTPLVYR